MKNSRITAIILIAAIGFLAASCSFNVSTASLDEVKMCTGINEDSGLCDQDNPVFPANSLSFHLSTKLNYAPEDTRITFSWYGYDKEEKVLIDKVTIRAGDFGSGSTFNLHSNLTRGDSLWPEGDYEVVISLDTDNSDPVTKTFKVI